MGHSDTTPAALWPLAVYFAAILLTAAGMIALSYFLGQRHREPATGKPYESGMPVTGSARLRLAADFYLVAMFFVIFDLESVFIFTWAVAVRSLGWAGFAAVSWFIVILMATLVYLWKVGSLDWAAPRKPAPPSGETGATSHVPATSRSRLGDDSPLPGEPRATLP